MSHSKHSSFVVTIGSAATTAAVVVVAAAATTVAVTYFHWKQPPTSSLQSQLSPPSSSSSTTTTNNDIIKNEDKKSRNEKKEKDDDDDINDDDDSRPILTIQFKPDQSLSSQQQQQHHEENEDHKKDDDDDAPSKARILNRGTITIVHGSMTGTCAKFASDLYQQIVAATETTSCSNKKTTICSIELGTIEEYDWWDELLNEDEATPNTGIVSQQQQQRQSLDPTRPATLIVLLPTYTNGTWPPSAVLLQQALQELQTDWRIAKYPLKDRLRVAIFGTGSSEYDEETMGRPAKEAAKAFQSLGAKIVTRLHVGDDAVGNHCSDSFDAWKEDLLRKLKVKQQTGSGESCGCTSTKKDGKECCQHTNTELKHCDSAFQEDGGYKDEEEEEEDDDDDDESNEDGEPEIMDLEDMGDAVIASRQQQTSDGNAEPREMVTPSQAKALKKEGYKLIGTHSAVKLCRWTKHQLRGRGGCYKHTFYGITSYQCMEATPSLACANKCVFCWRHHKNPVGKEWRWKTDDPYYIVDQAVQTHVQMIKETRGIPGVQLDRWEEAHTVKHCALSLVGEPIMYPRIDELLGELHRRNISTFLVTNGQHPAAIKSLRPITQLYVSVDAPTQESLIAIDRPLFQDAWDRLRQSLSALKDKGQRTVARLTVVKGWNSDEISGYAELIALGKVSLVEVKGVTFCGKSDASNLNMTNTPWHHEVVDLTRTLKQHLAAMRVKDSTIPEYDLACEHKHSCSVLLARVDQFAKLEAITNTRKWYTWIDYDKFQHLAACQAKDSTFAFTVEDYTAETPTWALFESTEQGFDPTDQRYRKHTKYPKYTQFDNEGVPTHDENGNEIPETEQRRLADIMMQKRKQIGEGSTVTELKGGAKEILDASLMFRGMVVSK